MFAKDQKLSQEEIQEAVRDFYDQVAQGTIQPQVATDQLNRSLGYGPEDLALVPREAQMGLGCGNPQEFSQPQEGEVVLDLGSGRGMDVFLASRRVGDRGLVYGLDQNEGMVERARDIAKQRGFANTRFLLGPMEDIPLEEGQVDLVISNCVINLSTQKDRVYEEIFRVLKPGGRLAISDIVLKQALPQAMKENPKLYGT